MSGDFEGDRGEDVEETVRRDLRADDAVIIDYEPRHRAAFRDLNLAWITTHFRVEDADRRALGDPEGYILARGGHILVAELDGVAVGVCALLRQDDGAFELAKMAVDPAVQRHRIGYALGRAAIERARALGAPRVELLSNTVLEAAVRLYRALGFIEVPLPETEYERANIKMVLELAGDR